MTANPAESFSRNLSNFPKVTTTFPFVGGGGKILPNILKSAPAALAVEVAVLLQGRGTFTGIPSTVRVLCTTVLVYLSLLNQTLKDG